MKEHELKIKKRFLERLISGEKTCEVRNNDRDFQSGDVIAFSKRALSFPDDPMPAEWEGKFFRFRITHVQHLHDVPEMDWDSGYVVLSLKN